MQFAAEQVKKVGHVLVVAFNLFKTLLLVPLALSYFMTSCLFTISSLMKLRKNPFAFSIN